MFTGLPEVRALHIPPTDILLLTCLKIILNNYPNENMECSDHQSC